MNGGLHEHEPAEGDDGVAGPASAPAAGRAGRRRGAAGAARLGVALPRRRPRPGRGLARSRLRRRRLADRAGGAGLRPHRAGAGGQRSTGLDRAGGDPARLRLRPAAQAPLHLPAAGLRPRAGGGRGRAAGAGRRRLRRLPRRPGGGPLEHARRIDRLHHPGQPSGRAGRGERLADLCHRSGPAAAGPQPAGDRGPPAPSGQRGPAAGRRDRGHAGGGRARLAAARGHRRLRADPLALPGGRPARRGHRRAAAGPGRTAGPAIAHRRPGPAARRGAVRRISDRKPRRRTRAAGGRRAAPPRPDQDRRPGRRRARPHPGRRPPDRGRAAAVRQRRRRCAAAAAAAPALGRAQRHLAAAAGQPALARAGRRRARLPPQPDLAPSRAGQRCRRAGCDRRGPALAGRRAEPRPAADRRPGRCLLRRQRVGCRTGAGADLRDRLRRGRRAGRRCPGGRGGLHPGAGRRGRLSLELPADQPARPAAPGAGLACAGGGQAGAGRAGRAAAGRWGRWGGAPGAAGGDGRCARRRAAAGDLPRPAATARALHGGGPARHPVLQRALPGDLHQTDAVDRRAGRRAADRLRQPPGRRGPAMEHRRAVAPG